MIPTLDKNDLIGSCDAYLGSRTGRYEWRSVRYRAALAAFSTIGLTDDSTVVDVGAGWTELDYCLRVDGRWRGRYIPVDGSIDGGDLERWSPPRAAEWFVALELLEHLYDPERLVKALQQSALKGIVISTPNPATTDVLGMDPTHHTAIHSSMLMDWGFQYHSASFYGQPCDSLFAVWTQEPIEWKKIRKRCAALGSEGLS